MAKQSLMKDAITDALRKDKGGNCLRSFASLAKVKPPIFSFLFFFLYNM
jgi:hypothetical protein